MTFASPMPIQLASPALAGEVSRASVTEGASSTLLPRASGGDAERSEAEWVFIFPSGCHGLTRRATREPGSPSASDHSNAQLKREPGCHHSTRSGAVVLLQTPKDTTARLRRVWCYPETSTLLPSPRGAAGGTSPAQAFNSTLIRKWGR
jgi:hypothetical protein